METMYDIKVEDIEELFDNEIFERGEEYFEEELVKDIELIDDKTLIGTVIGNDRYKVTISVDSDGEIVCDCTCPCDFNCKHAVALLLKWVNEKGNHKGKNSKSDSSKLPEKEETIKEILQKKNKEELVDLITNFLSKEPKLKSLITIRKNEIYKKVKSLFSESWGWNEVRILIEELGLILEGIKKNKSSWNKDLLDEMEKTSKILVNGEDNVHDDGDLSFFLNDWFEIFGEIFASIRPTIEEKKEFIEKIKKFIEKDDYGFDNDIERALYGMCKTKEDAELIKENYKIKDWYYDEKTGKESYDYKENNDFYLELYEKIGADQEYLKFAKEKSFSIEYVDKLISLERLKDALEGCYKQKEYNNEIEERKYKILKKLGKNKESQEVLFGLSKHTYSLDMILKLKKESSKKEWENYKKEIIEEAKKSKINEIVSKIYYHEEDYPNAYEYAKNLTNSVYLELLARKLSKNYPDKACFLLRKLMSHWISSGSGYPYKKAGKLLKEIKSIDCSGNIFKKIKNEVINEHKKKYSLMNIIDKI
ncbi:SWIM zinc finger family protein [Candidatus Woesearchaeota archaeon]|nr:SWIM zinc finger family protein [Candidatus Woesearchaeota archaeon]